LKELKRRDPKNLYKMFRNKQISNIVGLDIKFDKPINTSLNIKWNRNLTAIKISKKIINLIKN
jgi:adenylylsulfate kinase-like enzyme